MRTARMWCLSSRSSTGWRGRWKISRTAASRSRRSTPPTSSWPISGLTAPRDRSPQGPLRDCRARSRAYKLCRQVLLEHDVFRKPASTFRHHALGRKLMRQTTTLALCALAAVLAAPTAHAQQPLKIGVILPYSGQFADGATQLDNGIKLYVHQHGDAIAGRKIEIIRRDTGGGAPRL